MIQQNQILSSKDFNKGLVTRADLLKNAFDQSPNTMDVKWYFDGAIGKRLGTSTTNTVAIGSTAAAGWSIDSSGTLSTSLQVFWKFDETSGNRSDSFNSVILTDNNSVGSITGIRGNAADFVSTNSESLVRQTTSPIESSANFSISTWIYLNSTSTTIQRSIFSKRDPEIDGTTVLLLPCNGADGATTFPDLSASNHTVTANGNAQVDTAQQKFGSGSLLLDGSGDFLSIPDSADWDFGTGDFTVDAWIRLNSDGVSYIFDRGSDNWSINRNSSQGTLQFRINGTLVVNAAWSPSLNTWYHIAGVRSGINCYLFVDGVQLGLTGSDSTNINDTTELRIGANQLGTEAFNGWIDEIRITKGVARWTANFITPTKAYGVQEYEYWLFVNTNNQPTFRVSSTGTNHTASVQSAGALNTSTWYNIIAWHSNNSHIGIAVNNAATTTAQYIGGVRVGSAPLVFGAISDSATARATTYFDGRIDETGYWKKILSAQERTDLYGGGTANTYSSGASGFGWAMFDFGASSIRWLTVAAGTGIVASSNRGTTFVTIATSRTQNYQYFERSKNVLVATSDSYDNPLYWAGSVGTFMSTLAPNSAPAAKYSVNYQGFLILLNFQNSNGTVRNRGFAYADENSQLTSAWADSFDIPSSQDDEITCSFILSKFLYISTKTKLFRVAYVGGNPDWSYLKVKDWGFVPRTAKLMTLKGGQVVVGMDWNRRLRAFDGYEDTFVSDNVENDNRICDFATKKISMAGSGLVISHAEVDQVEQEYRLNVAIGADSTQTTHALLLNGRTLALYPYSNQGFQAMCVAESAGRQNLMAIDRSGYVHILNSGNMDVMTPINEMYDSPPIFGETPQQVLKSQNINTYFVVDSCGRVYYQEAFNMKRTFLPMRELVNLSGAEDKLLVDANIDIPASFNTYHFRLTSSAGTANPWKLSRWDLVGRVKGIGQG